MRMNLKSTVTSDRTPEGKQRYELLDMVRGITLISMILYHGAWDMVYLYGKGWPWYRSDGAYVWQQSICWTFIFLSGFCWSMGRKPLKRGLLVFCAGAVVTFVTIFVMPANRVVFGVLTLIGSCMLLMIPIDRAVRGMPKAVGFMVSLLLFVITRNVNERYLGFEELRLMKLPEGLYRNIITAYFGFPSASFFSTDYFSLLPWLFLFMAGYFLYHIMEDRLSWWLGAHASRRAFAFSCNRKMLSWVIRPFSFVGRHSLFIYMIHQPVLYVVCGLLAKIG